MEQSISDSTVPLPQEVIMKTKLRGRIQGFEKQGGYTYVHLESAGRVAISNTNAQDCELNGTLKVRDVVANEMKMGAILTITLSDEEPDERLT